MDIFHGFILLIHNQLNFQIFKMIERFISNQIKPFVKEENLNFLYNPSLYIHMDDDKIVTIL